jgi:hypothetical protein
VTATKLESVRGAVASGLALLSGKVGSQSAARACRNRFSREATATVRRRLKLVTARRSGAHNADTPFVVRRRLDDDPARGLGDQ